MQIGLESHSEPFAALKGKLREESLFLTGQTLRFAQGDSFEIVFYLFGFFLTVWAKADRTPSK